MEYNLDKFGNKYKIENGFLIQERIYGRIDKFEIVDSIPEGYIIWNIGENMVDGYLPLVKPLEYYNIDLHSMKAIKYDEAQTILNGLIGGDTLESLKQYINDIDNEIIEDRYGYDEMVAAIKHLEIIEELSRKDKVRAKP